MHKAVDMLAALQSNMQHGRNISLLRHYLQHGRNISLLRHYLHLCQHWYTWPKSGLHQDRLVSLYQEDPQLPAAYHVEHCCTCMPKVRTPF